MQGYRSLTGDDFPANSIGGQRFNTLDDLAGKIDLHGSKMAQEKGAAKAATEAKSARLESIRRQMKTMRETMVSCEPQQPGVSQHFNMPASTSAESIVEGARAFIATGTTMKPLFLSREMPENFLEVLADTIQSYEEAVNDYNLHSANRAAARAMLDDVCSQVLAVRRELDPIVRNKYRNDPEKLAMWETASHLERQAKRNASAEPGNGNQPPTGGNQPPGGGQA
jgi:hypothetical protein